MVAGFVWVFFSRRVIFTIRSETFLSLYRKKSSEVCLLRKVKHRFPFLSLPLQRAVLSARTQNGRSYLEAAYSVAAATECWLAVRMRGGRERGRGGRAGAGAEAWPPARGRLARCFEMGCLFSLPFM